MKLSQKIIISSFVFSSFVCSNVFAAGYSSELTSTSGLANSYAGSVTGIHDASDMFFNSAVLSDIKNGEFILSASYLDGKINTKNGSDLSGGSRTANVHDAGVNSLVPAFYVGKRINEDFVFGLAVTSPFGLATRYNSAWQGSDRAVASSIRTININPNLAYKVNDKFSLGAGIQAQYYNARLTSNPAGYYTKVHGSDWGYGFNLGAKYQATDKLKFGIGYRSKIDHNISGSINVSGLGSSDAITKTSTPESLTVGTAYKINSDIELAYDVTWTRWSRLKSFSIYAYQNPTTLSSSSSYNWHDSFLNSVGANFSINDKWLLRTGLAYEKEAMTDANRSPTVPLSDKVWTTIGFNYKLTKSFSVDATYLHQFYQNAVSRLNATSTANSLNVQYKTRVDVLSIALKKEF